MLRYLIPLVCVAVCFSAPTLSQATTGEAAANPQIPGKIDSVAEYVQKRLSDDDYTREAVTRKIRPTASDVADFVHHNTAFRPYWGTLKGADGVLLDRTGNTLDLSLLAAALLEDRGMETRIGFAQLDQHDAGQVLGFGSAAIPEVPEAIDIDAALLAVLLNEGGLSRDDIKAIVSDAPKNAAAARDEARSRAADFVAKVEAGIATNGDFLTPPPRDAQQLAMAAEYFWVEYRDGNAEWLVLEPLRIDLAASYRSGATYFAAKDIPDTLINDVSVAGVLEFADGRKQVLSGVTLTSGQGVFAPIQISNVPLMVEPVSSLDEALGISDTPPDTMIFRLALGITEIASVTYRNDGVIIADQSISEASDAGLVGIGGALDGLGQVAEEADSDTPGPVLETLKLAYTIRNSRGMSAPHGVVNKSRLVLSRQDASGSSFANADFGSPWYARLSIIPFDVEPNYVDYRALQSELMFLRTVAAFERGEALAPDAAAPALVFHASKAHRTAMYAREMTRNPVTQSASYADQMAVVVEETRLISRAQAAMVVSSIDLVQITAARTISEPADSGLAWTIAEKMVHEDISGQESDNGFATNFPSLMTSAGLTISRVADKEATTRFQDELAGSLLEDIEAGYDALVISHLGTGLYLSRDPYTGMVIGRMSDGRGQDSWFAELEGVQTIKTFDNIRTFTSFSEIVAHTLEFLLCFEAAVNAPDSGYELVRCMVVYGSNIGGIFMWEASVVISIVQTIDCMERTTTARADCLLGGMLAVASAVGARAGQAKSFAGRSAEIVLQGVGAGGKLYLSYKGRVKE